MAEGFVPPRMTPETADEFRRHKQEQQPKDRVVEVQLPKRNRPASTTLSEVWGLTQKVDDRTIMPMLVTSAFDPNPPMLDGKPFEPTVAYQLAAREDLDAAMKPLMKRLEPTIGDLSKFGYEWNDEIDVAKLKSDMLKLVK